MKKSPLNARRWSLIFTTVTISLIVTVFSINYIVDPYGYRSWIVEKKYKPIIHERSEKYTYIFHQNNFHKYDCIILGSSRVMSIMPKIHNNEKGCYNFGVHVANNPEKLFILEEWLKKAPLKKVYLGNELYNVHSNNNPLAISRPKFIQGSEGNYLSLATLNISLKSFLYALENKSQIYFESDGSIRYPIKEESIKNKTFDHSTKHFDKLAKDTFYNDYLHNPFTYKEQALYPLKQIKTLCNKHNIQLYPFITPTYSEMQNQFNSTPALKAASSKFRQDLIHIFGNVYDFDVKHPLNDRPENFYDAIHYRPLIAKQIVDEIENDTKSYGTLLSNKNFKVQGE